MTQFLNHFLWLFVFPEIHLENYKKLRLRHTLTLGPIVAKIDERVLTEEPPFFPQETKFKSVFHILFQFKKTPFLSSNERIEPF